MNRRQLIALANAFAIAPAGVFSLGTAIAQAQAQATKLLVGATPGGGTDIVARAIALELGKRLDRPFIVDNRPGAAGNIAALATAKAEPDGHTLLLSYTSHAINASLYDNLPFDPVKDFTPISQIASSPAMLVARPSFKANNVAELIALAKSQPGKLNIAVAGIGSANHLAGEMLKRDAGIDLVGVPYKGTGPADPGRCRWADRPRLRRHRHGAIAHQGRKTQSTGSYQSETAACLPRRSGHRRGSAGLRIQRLVRTLRSGKVVEGNGREVRQRREGRTFFARDDETTGRRRTHSGGQYARGVPEIRCQGDRSLGQGRGGHGRQTRVTE